MLNRRKPPPQEPVTVVVPFKNRNEAFLDSTINMTMVEFIVLLTKLGCGLKEVAELLEVPVARLIFMMGRYEELRDAVREARSIPDLKVVNALFSRCVGYNYVETVYDKKGVVEKQVFKHLPPDVTACIFWLKNRMKDEWADTWRGELTLKDRMDLGFRAQGG